MVNLEVMGQDEFDVTDRAKHILSCEVGPIVNWIRKEDDVNVHVITVEKR